jgi:hypothetical protein
LVTGRPVTGHSVIGRFVGVPEKHPFENLKKCNKSKDFVAVFHSYLQTLPRIFYKLKVSSLLDGLV